MSGFLEQHKGKVEQDPFAKKKKAAETKVVKVNADLHYTLKTHVALENDGSTITDHINKAVTEYIEKNRIKPPTK